VKKKLQNGKWETILPFIAFVLLIGARLVAAPPSPPLARAQTLVDENQLQPALAILNDALRKDPENVQALYLRGYVFYRLRDLVLARRDFAKVIALAPPAPRSQYFLGRIALLESHPEEAIRWLQAPARETPPVEDAPAQLGKAYLDTGQLPEAREWTEKALQLAPWDGALHYRLARVYQQSGEKDLAAKEFAATLDLKGTDQEVIRNLVDCSRFIAQGDLIHARQIRDSLLQRARLDPDVLVALGSSFATAGFAADAISPFHEAAQRDPALFNAQFDLGLGLLNLGRSADAVAPLEASLKIYSNSADANATLGLAYVMLGRFPEALPRLEIAHSLQPDNIRTEGLLSVVYLRTGAASKAVPLVKHCLEKQPDDPKLYFLLIDCLNSTDDQTGALAVAEQAVLRFPSLAKAHLAKAQQLARLGRYQQAGPSFLQAVDLAPEQAEPLLGLAEVQNKSADYSGSLASYRRVLALEPANLTAELGAARDLIALGEPADARDILQSACTAHSENRQLHIELSRVYARLGDRDHAAEQMRILERLPK
jgi:tetratricopeptide (TPR) repeat protein